ncbi:MAG: hypothetical protein QXO30_03000 [Candidatus Caldarchaeum sp.]
MEAVFLRRMLEAKTLPSAAASAFAVIYVLAVGIVFPLPYDLPPTFPTPSADVVLDGPLGQAPWITVYLNSRWVVSVNPEALTALVVLTTLVWLNTAALTYLSRHAACRPAKNIHLSWMAVVPAFFSFFSCCGTGVVSGLILASGASLSMLAFLQDYGRLFTALSAFTLTANLYMLYRKTLLIKTSRVEASGLKLSQLVDE